MALGPTLARFWRPKQGQVGAMLGLCSLLGPSKRAFKKHFKKHAQKRARGPERPTESGGGPLEQRKTDEKGYQGEKKMQKIPHGAQGAVVDIYIYIYIY